MPSTRSPLANPSAAAEIGVSRRDITPPVGIYSRSWGAARHDVAEGIHRPLTATAMALRQDADSSPLVLVAVDAGWWQLAEDEFFVRGAVIERFGLEPARVMICIAHTHAGPSICRADADKPGGGLVAGYLAQFRDAIIDAVEEAIRTARPSVLTWSYGRCSLAVNRDLPDPDRPRIVCGYNPEQPADDTLLVGRVADDATGRTVGTIVNYACHPTTLAWDNRLISPDYVGAMRDVVEDHTAGAPCLFLQGCSGELAPREQYVGDTAVADRNGRWLGFAALATLESMLPPATALAYGGVVESGAPLAIWHREPFSPSRALAAAMVPVPLPLKPLPPEEEIRRELDASTDRTMAERLRRKLRVRRAVGVGPTCEMPVWIWRIGDGFLVGQPNEAYSAFQTHLREWFPDRTVAVMNLVNGCVGYLSPPELHDLDIYQVWQTPFDRPALPTLINVCEQQMRKLLEKTG